MSNIIKKKVQTARQTYDCDECRNPILNGHKYLYMFGSAHKGEKPYSLRICLKCDQDKRNQ